MWQQKVPLPEASAGSSLSNATSRGAASDAAKADVEHVVDLYELA
jgi:hypothetical protein